MTIYFNPATEKYPAKLNIGDKLTVADIIGIDEMVAVVSDVSVDLLMVLSSNCIGIESKEKPFNPAGKKCKLSFFKDKKQQWSNDDKKYVEATVSKDENYLYTILKHYIEANPAAGYSGHIAPWVNPFFWDLVDQNTTVSSEMAGTIKDKLLVLSPLSTLAMLTEEDKKTLATVNNYGNKTGYTKAESESEKLTARFQFFRSQLANTVGDDFKTVDELALILPGLDPAMTTAAALAIQISLDLIGRK